MIWTLNLLRVQLTQDRQGFALPDPWQMVLTSAFLMDTSFSPTRMPPGDGVENSLKYYQSLPLLLLLLLSPGTMAGPGASSLFAFGLLLNYMAPWS